VAVAARRFGQIPPCLSCCGLLSVEIGNAKEMHQVLQCVVQGWEQEVLRHGIGKEFVQAGVLGIVPVAVDC